MKITKENLLKIVLNQESREALLQDLEKESGTNLPIRNAISNAAPNVKFNENEISDLMDILLHSTWDEEIIFENFIFNPDFPEPMLHQLYEADKFVTALAHRTGPIDLLLKIARNKSDHEEALLTLGQIYFRSPEITPNEFKEFLIEFKNNQYLFVTLDKENHGDNEKSRVYQRIRNSSTES